MSLPTSTIYERITINLAKQLKKYKKNIFLGTFLAFWTYIALCLQISHIYHFKEIIILISLIMFFTITDIFVDTYIIKKEKTINVKQIFNKYKNRVKVFSFPKTPTLKTPGKISTDTITTIKRIILFALPLICGWTFYLIAFYPGLMSPDSFNQWKQIQDLTQLNDHHPYIHTMIMYLLTRIYNSPSIITVTQILLMSLTYGVGLEILYRRKLNKIIIYCILLFLALSPSYGITNVTLWKDIWFAAFIFWTTISLLFLLEKKRMSWLMISVSLVLIAIFRHNGTYVVYVLLPILFFFTSKTNFLKILSVTGILLIFFIYIIPSVFHIGSGFSPGMKYLSFNRYIGYVMTKHGDETDPELVKLAERTMPVETWTNCFYIYRDRYNEWACPENTEYKTNRYQYNEYYPELIYVLIREYPMDTFHAFKKATSMIWSIGLPEGTYLSYYKTSIIKNNFGLKTQENRLTPPAHQLLKSSRKLGFVFYRGGIYILLLIYTAIKSLQRRDYHYVYILFPIVLTLGTLLIVLPAQDYRYTYFMPFIVPFLVGLFLTRKITFIK